MYKNMFFFVVLSIIIIDSINASDIIPKQLTGLTGLTTVTLTGGSSNTTNTTSTPNCTNNSILVNGVCFNISTANFTDPLLLSNYTFNFKSGHYLAITTGIIRVYKLTNNVFTLSSNILDLTVTPESFVYAKGNLILVSNPLNETTWSINLWSLNIIWTLQNTFTSIASDTCTNVGKSTVIMSTLTEVAFGGDQCTIFYKFISNTWQRTQVVAAEGALMVIGNNNNLIVSNAGYPGFGSYLFSNYICRNDNNSVWALCYQNFNLRGNMPTKFVLCDNNFGFEFQPDAFNNYYDLTYFTYTTSNEVWNIYASQIPAFDSNAIVSTSCDTFIYNSLNTATNVASAVVMKFNDTAQNYYNYKTLNISVYSSQIGYLFDTNELITSVTSLTSLLQFVTQFPLYDYKK